jgi:CRISP-associated protein Cas1
MQQLIVDTQGVSLQKQGERLNVHQNGDIIQSVPMGSLEQVILMGRGVNISTPLLYDLLRREVDVIFQSRGGRFGFRMVGPAAKHSALRVQQTLVATDPARALALARALIEGKLHNQAMILRRYGGDQNAIRTIAQQMVNARQAASLDSLRGHEGSAAAAYFGAWRGLFDARRWGFSRRAYHPPPDPVNAMLGFAYTMLLNDITAAVYQIGLDPMIGLFHAIDYGRPSLSLDLEEEFRPGIADAMVLVLLREHVLTPGDFQHTGEGPILMTDSARRFFIARYQEHMAMSVRYPAWDQELTYRQCIKRQAEHMARCIQGRDEVYRPLLLA